ncbi:hypothetical protein B0H19DRAFT_1067705 [Mycena capillaripes]|nr:hypothetical protein B0H19DRAFT_1067705 [Mycena capillaripes]
MAKKELDGKWANRLIVPRAKSERRVFLNWHREACSTRLALEQSQNRSERTHKIHTPVGINTGSPTIPAHLPTVPRVPPTNFISAIKHPSRSKVLPSYGRAGARLLMPDFPTPKFSAHFATCRSVPFRVTHRLGDCFNLLLELLQTIWTAPNRSAKGRSHHLGPSSAHRT